MENKQTAVEWLVSQLNKQGFSQVVTYDEIEKAKQMEKGQIIDAVNYGCSDWGSFKDVEQYYNETYGK